MNTPVTGLLLSVLLLLTLRLQELVDGCTCSLDHPQTIFCNSDVALRVLVTSKRLVSSGNMPPGTVEYTVKQDKTYKEFEKNEKVEYIYTASSSAACGVELEINNWYLITGRIGNQGKIHIGLCNWIARWDDLTSSQQQYLHWNKYEMGCSCQIVSCLSLPCPTPAKNQCVWTDLVTEKTTAGSQAKNSVCLKQRDGFCYWCGGGSASVYEP
ncbi:metalloproteinase inhibitor 4.3 [Heptranchias perlo]|uniref:metalloproteinase inhibitor 4.3 n=1 Tax=Heptranchias perlo TaxID=212740 RepID=UPI00355962D3